MSFVEVVLLRRVLKLGQMGDRIKVKAGYARNYLLPQKIADRATDENLKRFDDMRVQLEANNLQLKSEAESVAERMDGTKLTMVRQAGENGLLYGSVRTQDIADSLGANGFSVGRGQVQIDSPIKTLGVHTIKISLHPEVEVSIKLAIALTQEEADSLFATQ